MLGRTQTASPARDALKGNLDTAATSDTGLTLKKKKSWFDSMRDGAHKVALQAKAAVDLFRNDPQKPEQFVNHHNSLLEVSY